MATTTSTNLGDKVKEISIVDSILDNRQLAEVGIIGKFNLIKADGPIKIIAENENLKASFYGEMETVATADNSLIEYQLNPNKRVAQAIEVSRELLETSGVDYAQHISQLMTTRIARTIESAILSSGVDNNTKNLPRIHSLANINDTGTSTNPLSATVVRQAYFNFLNNNNNLDGAFWLFSKSSNLSVQDTAGNELLKFDNVPKGANAMLLGIPVYFVNLGDTTDATPKITRAMLINPNAYTIALKDNTVKQIAGDTTQSLRGSSVFLGEVYVDGKMTNSYGKYAISQPS